MEELQISNEQVEMVQNELFDSTFWYYQLGISISNEVLSSDKFLSFDFFNSGKDYWEKILNKLMDILCDKKNKVPKSTLDELLNGDLRNLIVYLITLLVTDLGVAISVSIPIVSLILKKGLRDFCMKNI